MTYITYHKYITKAFSHLQLRSKRYTHPYTHTGTQTHTHKNKYNTYACNIHKMYNIIYIYNM